MEFWREAEILSKLHHPNVVAFYGVVQDGPGGTMATVAEFMVDGSLRHVLLRKDRCKIPLPSFPVPCIESYSSSGQNYCPCFCFDFSQVDCPTFLIMLHLNSGTPSAFSGWRQTL